MRFLRRKRKEEEEAGLEGGARRFGGSARCKGEER